MPKSIWLNPPAPARQKCCNCKRERLVNSYYGSPTQPVCGECAPLLRMIEKVRAQPAFLQPREVVRA